ncbi:MAG TPA: BlaI/MecI/CopY family transcriptional regulator [Steroidobacteraceae bacterium]|nr:BlaI/MecI/CopY family transcriptional regulator [Steroidobacteraceae bacterium]
MKISASEREILKVLWQATSPLPAEEVVAMLGTDPHWSAGTVRTFLARLVKKKAVAAQKDGRRYLYRPLVSRADYAHRQSRNLIDSLFNGRIVPFVTQFSERQTLSREEIDELKLLIKRLDREH